MFKKLKQRIHEEQPVQRNAQSPQQAQVGSGGRRGSLTPPFPYDGSPSASDRESATKGPETSPRGSINGDGRASPQQREEPQSFAQKLQLKVPSMESLIRGGASRAEHLFRSPSKESLVRTSSRESLTPLGENESPGVSTYDPPSDIESEAEEPPGKAESMSKEQLLHRLLRVERSLGKYRGKYSELVTAYRTVQREKEKTQAILSQSQDKSLRRIGELREELQMDQQAKKHLQEEFDAALEEKDQMISVLQTQVSLLKKRAKGDDVLQPEGDVPQEKISEDAASVPQSPSKMQTFEGEGNGDPAKLMEALQKRVTRQENLLQKCKEVIRTHKERSALLSSENETLHEQLQERLQELEKIKELHTNEKTKLINQLRDAKNHIEQLEQDKGMVIAETKRQMHETLEMKEEEIAQLRSRLQQVTTQIEDLQEQKEKSEKSAFEELERALGVAQRAEEARKQLQGQLEEQVRQVEKASDEERKTLQQELTNVKQEVVAIMKKSSEEKVAHLEMLHSEAMLAKDEEMTASINKAVEQCKEELALLAKEREQQVSLALEDAELQKTAIKTEADNKLKEIQLELELTRTRILELESSVDKVSQDESSPSKELSSQLEELKKKHRQQISELEEKHQEQLEKHKVTLTQQQDAVLQELEVKHRAEMEALLKEKELEFQAHVIDMSQKTMEKLDAKQAELEALSAELSDALKCKQQLEETLLSAEKAHGIAQRENEKKLHDLELQHGVELANIKEQNEQSVGGVEKTLKEELNALNIVLREKEKEITQLAFKEKALHCMEQNLEMKTKEYEALQESFLLSQQEASSLKESNEHLNKIAQEIDHYKKDMAALEQQLEVVKTDCQQKEKSLQELEHQVQETKRELLEREKSLNEELNIKVEEQTLLQKELKNKTAFEAELKNAKAEIEAKLKSQESKMEKWKQKAKEMQEKFKSKLQQSEENMKKELAKKDKELQEKEQQVQEKIVEMAQNSSQGLSNAVSELQSNHMEELEKLYAAHKHVMEELESRWHEKLGHQEEELMEKHSLSLQEKCQELEEMSQQLSRSRMENEQVLSEINDLKEGLAIRETTVQKLQEELNEAALKLENLSQGEALLKEQIESAERNLNQALNERNSLQDKLNTTKEKSKEKLSSLSNKLEETERLLKTLQQSRCQESEDMKCMIDETSVQLKAKEADLKQQLITISNQLALCCTEIQSKMESGSNDLEQKVQCRVNELRDRLLCSQKKIGLLKNILLSKGERICTLEETLQQQTEEKTRLCISLEEVTAQVNVHLEHIKALTQEKENHCQSFSEQHQKIEELIEMNRIASESVKSNEVHIANLENIISDLKNQLSGSITEKEEAINILNQQYVEERQRAAAETKEAVKRLEQERELALEQAEVLRNSLSEKELKSTKIISSLQAQLVELERDLYEKNEALQRLTTCVDNQSISKSEMDQVLSEKEQKVSGLTSELETCLSRISDLHEQLALKTKECEQLTSDLKQQHSIRESEKSALEQLQMQSAQNGNLEQEMAEKLHLLEEDNQKYKHTLESQREEFERMRDEIKSKEENLKETEERINAESARKVSELKKKAEQKISQIRKQLASQLEEKEHAIQTLQTSLEDIKSNETSGNHHIETLEEKNKSLEGALVKLQDEQKIQLEQMVNNERLEREKALDDLKAMYENQLISCQRNAEQQRELKESESAIEYEAKLKALEQQNENLLREINHLKEEISEKNIQLVRHQTTMNQAQGPSEAVVENVVSCNNMQQTKTELENDTENHSTRQEQEDADTLKSLKRELVQMKNDKEKIHKDFTRLQKDMRVLRKEHQQELEYMKKELLEDNEKKLKLELEDLQIRHNSAMKQIMREVNTQVALKENELDATVKETIVKAQAVEEELINSHHEEVNELKKVISQKEEELHRTVQKYEEVLQSREEEMGDRVWQVQKQLEELQSKSQSSSETPITKEDLQAQLAEKTTLLSEARLKEQGFVERIHSLEDKIKFLHRGTVVTHLGSTYKDPVFKGSDALSEATEMEYLRKVLFEYMMGRETKTMAKVITSMLKFPPDQAQIVLDKEETKTIHWLR
ncbi:golgin subfamily A member 4 isoform X3 [Gouania willdenowi]|uniref:GRIP domain-containing protein n=1 Tax=Gouania willdenowi TaxID=441366 RepID=A0A8C5HE01_GOUWI|nr:golgin subfamily A member 4 isoform X3 [Gouania willdenowi]